MSYPPLPRAASAAPGSEAAEGAIRSLLGNLAARKEFRSFGRPGPTPGPAHRRWDGFGPAAAASRLFLPGLRLNGAQLFIRNFENPDTEYTRVLVKWQTGTGKSIAAISISQEFIRQYRARAAVGAHAPTVFIISFTARETIQEDMLRYPEFGFISQFEVEELRRLRAAAGAAGAASGEARQLAGLVGVLRRRITDRGRGGYYQFYGFKEFANRLFAVTRAGLERGFDVQTLYGRAEGAFGEQLSAAVRRGDVVVNEDLLAEMRGGLIVADEIHNVYNILETNNYGIAIQYALDALGDEAPRAVFMSATPVTGSAAEIVDLLNLLVPRSALPGGAPLRRADFFTRAAAPSGAADGEEGDAPEPAASHLIVSQLREGALERIAHLAAGRVSFLLDADVDAYPRRLFVGDEVAGVPYLRLTCCPMSPFHERTLAHAREAPAAGAAEEAPEPAADEAPEPAADEAPEPAADEAPEPAAPGAVAGLMANAYTLYDLAFPNPAFAPDAAAEGGARAASFGLYRSGETPTLLSQAPEEWRSAAGVIVEKGSEAGLSSGTYVITGPFLGPERLGLYSTKFARVVAATHAAVRAGPGKVMIYHHRVRMSGVLLLQEALRMNGFADEASAATDATICAICGTARAAHSTDAPGADAPGADATDAPGADAPGAGADATAPHAYTPARFIVAHSDIDRTMMMRSIARFNSPTNLQGHQFRVIIGSKIVREGLNFRGVRHQLIASLPTDFPTMVQVFGRVVRKDSHAELPADERNVEIRVFVSTYADGRPSPELQRYIDKGREYLIIQEVERALHEYAVDGFANYERIRAALHAGPGGELRPSLDALPYSPVVGPGDAAARPVQTATYLAYGHGEREVATLTAVCRALFRVRAVWTYADLWAAVRAGAVRGASFDPAAYDEGNFALALEGLRRPAGDPPALVARAGRFYIAARARPDGSPQLDVESYLRHGPPPARVSVRVADYILKERSGQNWEVRLREFERKYLAPGAPSTPELSLVECGAAFHYALLRQLVAAPAGRPVTGDDARLRELYRRFRIAVTVADAALPAAARVYRGGRSRAPDEIVGYVTSESVSLYEEAGAHWYSASLADFAIGRRHRENDIVVGFVAAPGATGAAGDAGKDDFTLGARFKIRPPTQKLRAAIRLGDIRNLARGAVCETRSREELGAYVRRLRDAVARLGVTPQATRGGGALALGGSALALAANLEYASSFDFAAQKRYPSAGEMCDTLRLHLLALEEDARAPANGMTGGLRWLYLFNDRAPSVSALMGPAGEAPAPE
jgi:hypothetical protein